MFTLITSMWLRILFTLQLSLCCCIAGGFIGRMTSPSNGLVEATMIFWYVVGGMVLGIIAGMFISRSLHGRKLFHANLIAGVTVLILVSLVYILDFNQIQHPDVPGPRTPTAVPTGWTPDPGRAHCQLSNRIS